MKLCWKSYLIEPFGGVVVLRVSEGLGSNSRVEGVSHVFTVFQSVQQLFAYPPYGALFVEAIRHVNGIAYQMFESELIIGVEW